MKSLEWYLSVGVAEAMAESVGQARSFFHMRVLAKCVAEARGSGIGGVARTNDDGSVTEYSPDGQYVGLTFSSPIYRDGRLASMLINGVDCSDAFRSWRGSSGSEFCVTLFRRPELSVVRGDTLSGRWASGRYRLESLHVSLGLADGSGTIEGKHGTAMAGPAGVAGSCLLPPTLTSVRSIETIVAVFKDGSEVRSIGDLDSLPSEARVVGPASAADVRYDEMMARARAALPDGVPEDWNEAVDLAEALVSTGLSPNEAVNMIAAELALNRGLTFTPLN